MLQLLGIFLGFQADYLNQLCQKTRSEILAISLSSGSILICATTPVLSR
jgi:hypothetical protein